MAIILYLVPLLPLWLNKDAIFFERKVILLNQGRSLSIKVVIRTGQNCIEVELPSKTDKKLLFWSKLITKRDDIELYGLYEIEIVHLDIFWFCNRLSRHLNFWIFGSPQAIEIMLFRTHTADYLDKKEIFTNTYWKNPCSFSSVGKVRR